MKVARQFVPFLGLCALLCMFFMLPETPNPFGIFGCKNCSAYDPYFALISTFYFAALLSISLVFPNFPGPNVARSGLIWSVLLAFALMYIKWPGICVGCLIGHICNILIWTIWFAFPQREKPSALTIKDRLCLCLITPVTFVALFACLNITFLVYQHKNKQQNIASNLHAGDGAPAFAMQTTKGTAVSNSTIILNFVSPGCPYCQEQLPIINALAGKIPGRIVNVSANLPEDLIKLAPQVEWLEDKDNRLRNLFQVLGYPTLFVIEEGKIKRIIPGVPEGLNQLLL